MGWPCRFCGMALRTMIVPPVIGKRFEDVGKIAFLWNLALREMRAARNVVIIGVSLAPTDFDLRWLIREGIGFTGGHEVHVDIVNPNAEHRAEVINILPKSVSGYREFETIENYLLMVRSFSGRFMRIRTEPCTRLWPFANRPPADQARAGRRCPKIR